MCEICINPKSRGSPIDSFHLGNNASRLNYQINVLPIELASSTIYGREDKEFSSIRNHINYVLVCQST